MDKHNCSILIIRSKVIDIDLKKHLSSKIDEIRNDCNLCSSDSIKNKDYLRKIFRINKDYIMEKAKSSPGYMTLMLSKDLITFLKCDEVYFSYFDVSDRMEFDKMKVLVKKYNLKKADDIIDLINENRELEPIEVLLIKKVLRKNNLHSIDRDLFN